MNLWQRGSRFTFQKRVPSDLVPVMKGNWRSVAAGSRVKTSPVLTGCQDDDSEENLSKPTGVGIDNIPRDAFDWQLAELEERLRLFYAKPLSVVCRGHSLCFSLDAGRVG